MPQRFNVMNELNFWRIAVITFCGRLMRRARSSTPAAEPHVASSQSHSRCFTFWFSYFDPVAWSVPIMKRRSRYALKMSFHRGWPLIVNVKPVFLVGFESSYRYLSQFSKLISSQVIASRNYQNCQLSAKLNSDIVNSDPRIDIQWTVERWGKILCTIDSIVVVQSFNCMPRFSNQFYNQHHSPFPPFSDVSSVRFAFHVLML